MRRESVGKGSKRYSASVSKLDGQTKKKFQYEDSSEKVFDEVFTGNIFNELSFTHIEADTASLEFVVGKLVNLKYIFNLPILVVDRP
jgi:hypothetical protein